MHTHWLTISTASITLVSLLACTSTADTEIPAPTPVVTAPETPPPPGGRKGKAGKHGKRGKATPGASKECPQGVVASPSWPGEYPGPVVDVVSPVEVKARPAPCATATLSCTLPKGIYHPWSEVASDYLTVRSVDQYTVAKAATIGGKAVAIGDIVEVVQYLGEGFCSYRIAGADAEDSCPDLLEGAPLTAVAGAKIPEVELFSIPCGTATGWVEATDALLALPEVRPGSTPEWGTVAPGTE